MNLYFFQPEIQVILFSKISADRYTILPLPEKKTCRVLLSLWIIFAFHIKEDMSFYHCRSLFFHSSLRADYIKA